MDWVKYDRLIYSRKRKEKKQEISSTNLDRPHHCTNDCWLKDYRPPPLQPERTDFQPYEPKSSPIYCQIKTTQIRILRIHPGDDDDHIITDLLPARLTGADGTVEIDCEDELVVPYHILSYSWGYGGKTTNIKCNGIDFEVLDSLYQALLRLRHPVEEVYYWIDAICINQTDPVEKAVQITKMFALYSQAQETTVWLGRADQCGFETFRFLAEFEDQDHDPECMAGIAFVCSGAHALASRPWFERTWVRQEVFASSKIMLRVGQIAVEYDYFNQNSIRAIEWLNHLEDGKMSGSQAIDVSGLDQLAGNLTRFTRVEAQDAQNLTIRKYDLLLEKKELSLESVLRRSSSFKATNARDYIYGIVSMTSTPTYAERAQEPSSFSSKPLNSTAMTLDKNLPLFQLPTHYTRPLAQVFTEATVYVMHFHKSLDLIFLNSQLPEYEPEPFTSSKVADINLPTWATDWRHVSHWSFLDSVWLLIDQLAFKEIPNSARTLHMFKESDKQSNPKQQGTCGVKGSGGAWNDKEAFDKVAEQRIVFGSENNSAFTNIKEFLYELAPFDAYTEADVMKLRCFGVILGSLTTTTASTQEGNLQSELRQNTKITNTVSPLFHDSKYFPITERYFNDTMEYIRAMISKSSQAHFKDVDTAPVDEVKYVLPSLYKSEKPLARLLAYGLPGSPLSHFCFQSDIGRMLATSPSLAPQAAIEGDLVVMLKGCSLPAVIRMNPMTGEHTLIGPILNVRYIAEESLRRLTAELWFKHGDKYEFYPDLERKSAPLEGDLPMETFVFV